MITLSHPQAPTVTYPGDIISAVLSYAKEHLPGCHVHAVADGTEKHGIKLEVIHVQSNTPAAQITIH